MTFTKKPPAGLAKSITALLLALLLFVTGSGSMSTASAAASADVIRVKQVGMGALHTCVLSEVGVVYCWGKNLDVEGATPIGLTNVAKLVVRDYVGCVVKVDGKVFCWRLDTLQGVYVRSDLGNIQHLAVGLNNSKTGVPRQNICAIDAHRILKCWDSHGTELARTWKDVSAVSLGKNEICPRLAFNSWGCLPGLPVGLIDLSVAETQYCGLERLTSDVVVWCDSASRSSIPKHLTSIVTANWLVSDRGITCVRTTNRPLECWGPSLAKPIVSGDSVSYISVGEQGVCVVTNPKLLRCWGRSGVALQIPSQFALQAPSPPKAILIVPRENNQAGLVITPMPGVFQETYYKLFLEPGGQLICDTKQGTELCALDLTSGKTYKVSAVAYNGVGQSAPIVSAAYRHCNASWFLQEESPTRVLSGTFARLSWRYDGLCYPPPNTISVRTKTRGTSWSPWFTVNRTKSYWKLNRLLTVDTWFQIKGNFENNTKVYSASVGVIPRIVSDIGVKSTLTSQGFSQGGYLDFRLAANKEFTGTCSVEASTDHAFNFALTRMGTERKKATFSVKNGWGHVVLKMRWNGIFVARFECESVNFVTYHYKKNYKVKLKSSF